MQGQQDEIGKKADATGDTEQTNSRGSQSSTPKTQGVTYAMAFLIAILASLITNGGMLIAYDHWLAPKIVSVDLKGFMSNQRDLYLAGKINDEQLRASIDHMADMVKSLPSNRIVMMGDAVIQGVEKVELGGENK